MEWIREVVDFWVGFAFACFIGAIFALKIYGDEQTCRHKGAPDDFKLVLTSTGFVCAKVEVARD